MGRLWSILFLMVPVLGVALFLLAMGEVDLGFFNFQYHWLPENMNDHGHVIDSLFMFILVLTGAIFIATGLAMFWFLWKYDGARNKQPVVFSHGSHTLEIVWSILPAAVLLFIAIYQMNAWADAKMRRPMAAGGDHRLGTADDVPQPPLARVTGRQFEWRIQYAGRDRELDTADDLYTVNELHVAAGEEAVLEITSDDVLHSFFLPNMRIKQDVVPGMKQFVWFRANPRFARGQDVRDDLDVVCAELCGWGHYKMRGRMYVHRSEELFWAWYDERFQEQMQTGYTKPAEVEE